MHRHPPRHHASAYRMPSRKRSRERLARTEVGDPRDEDTRMGALASLAQRDDVRERIRELEAGGARIVAGEPGAEARMPGGAFLQPMLLRTEDPWRNNAVHD